MIKIKSILNKWNSIGRRMGRSYSKLSTKSHPLLPDHGNKWDEITINEFAERKLTGIVHADSLAEVPEGCKTVYVGKCRRRYFISSEYMKHPLLRALILKTWKDGFSVDCEVVLFEHLVWMLENDEPGVSDSESSLKELAQFYDCN